MQTRLEIILETLNSILESSPARRERTKMGKVMAHSDRVRKGVPEEKIPYMGAPAQRGKEWKKLSQEEKNEVVNLGLRARARRLSRMK
jgi:hypothetical protein